MRKDLRFQSQDMWNEFEHKYPNLVKIGSKKEMATQGNEINHVKDIISRNEYRRREENFGDFNDKRFQSQEM